MLVSSLWIQHTSNLCLDSSPHRLHKTPYPPFPPRLPQLYGPPERVQSLPPPSFRSYTDPLKEHSAAEQLGKYEGLVETAVDLDQIEHGEYIIAPGYDPSLQKIKDERDKCESQIRDVYAEAAKYLGLKGQDVEKVLKLDRNPQVGC